MWDDERFEWEEDDELGLEIFRRVLGSNESDYGKDAYDEEIYIPIFYRILKYGIFTLYLILFVEFLRHTMDSAARGRPFFTAVLLMVYSELATLGIVEFGVFLWGKYGYIPKDIKAKFADVHFALFLTAIFNALQYSFTSIVSTRLSNGLWVKTEQLELDHYVEIREEYDRVQKIIDMQYTGCGKWVRNFILFVFRPGLRRRHESLRVQVRFHELRLHFLEFNSLPFSLKVSDYLKRSELSILIGLVHVSVATWVLLIGILNVGYFIFGIIGYAAPDPSAISVVLAVLFFLVVTFFIFMSLALRWKMHKIFQTVMKTKVIESSGREEGIKNQKELFWFGSPPLVISMIQLMNFGYAISISIVIIYWEYMNEKPGLRAEIYLVTSLGCYGMFLYNLSALLPEYTLCTSLGYLTNQKELQETVAMHRLEEAERQRRKRIIENATVNDSTILRAYPVVQSNSVAQNMDPGVLSSVVSSVSKSSIGGVLPGDEDKNVPVLVSDLVKVDTDDLRSSLPEKSREILQSREERIRQRRANRKKSVSDGVAAMRAWKPVNATNTSEETPGISKRNRTRRSRIRKTTSQPGVIRAWQNMTASEEQMNKPRSLNDGDYNRVGKTRARRRSNSDPRSIQGWKNSLVEEKGIADTKAYFTTEKQCPTLEANSSSKEENNESIPNWKRDRLHRLAARRQARKKTQSASAIIQSWQDHSTQELSTEKGGFSSDENYNSSDLRALSSDDGSDDNTQRSKAKLGRFIYGTNKYTEPLVERRSSLRTLKETEDHIEASQCVEGSIGAASETKVILDFSHVVIVDKGNDPTNNDSNTVDSDKSIGGLSDIDVIQGEKVGIVCDPEKTPCAVEADMTLFAMSTREARQYFLSSMYRNISHVVGTSIVFCFVGSRVEIMLKMAETSKELESPLLNVSTFWLEVVFLSCFLLADFIILMLFPVWKNSGLNGRRLSLATVIDVLIVSIVLVLLLFSEAQRCCTEENDGTSSGIATEDYEELGDDYYTFASDCTCPEWGTRTYGGLGIIEPFTSLVFLRLFRFQFAQCFINCLDHKRDSGESTESLKSNFDTEDENKYEDHGRLWHDHESDHGNNSGSALELWERAIADFPDIVENHGQFSSELLQAMLGLDPRIISPTTAVTKELEASTATKREIKEPNESEIMKSHVKLAQSRYSKLSPDAQGIVIAGSLRKPVKPVYSNKSGTDTLEPSFSSIPSTGLVDFVVDHERIESEQNATYSFVAPFARLVRSMRRCDRRHLPLLKGWISVDVVMTQFEIVYFEAIDTYHPDLEEKTRSHCEACRLALKATKGGKNLRLCDVALGRKVVGHVDLADITEVHVVKDDVPISDLSLVKKAAELFDQEKDLGVEHWSTTHQTEANKKYARIIRWSLIKEERLKISTNSGTLYFRFYSDLASFEAENAGESRKESHAITRDIAFQWAETITRIVGRSQLRQNLPHFGEGNEAELRDYLELIHFHEKEAENEKRKGNRSSQNVGNVELLFVDTDESAFAKKKTMHKRFKSMIDLSRATMHGQGNLEPVEEITIDFMDVTQPDQSLGFRRSLSVGDQLSNSDSLV